MMKITRTRLTRVTTLFFLFFIAGCGSGGSNPPTSVNLTVDPLTQGTAVAVTNATVVLTNPDTNVSTTCYQTPTQLQVNDPTKCSVSNSSTNNNGPGGGTGSVTEVLVTFLNVPIGPTYTLTGSVGTTTGSCTITINALSAEPKTGPCSAAPNATSHFEIALPLS